MIPTASLTTHSDFRFLRYAFDLLVLYWILQFFVKPDGLNIENVAISGLLVLAVVALFVQIFIGSQKNQTLSQLDLISKLLFGILLLVSAVTFMRGISTSPSELLTLFFNPIVGGTIWMLPIFILIGTQRGVLEALHPSFRRHAKLSLPFSLIAFASFQFGNLDWATSAIRSSQTLLYPAYFVLLAGMGDRSYRRMFVVAILATSVGHALLVNRLHFAVGLSVILVYLVTGSSRNKANIWLRAIGGLVFFIPLTVMYLQLITLRLPQVWALDTRSFLFYELSNEFSAMDFIFGLGALGGYYSEYFYALAAMGIEGGDAAFRQSAETGYLHIIIKAGLIGVVAIVLLKFRALLLARHLRDYRQCFGISFFILLHLSAMYIGYYLAFDPFHIFSYLIIGWAISEANRNTRRVT